jgi:hypothetical protein
MTADESPDGNLPSNRRIAETLSALREMLAEARKLKAVAGGSVTDAMAAWLAPQYVLAVRGQLATLPDGQERLKVLRLAANDLAALRRGDHSADRLVLDRERLALDRFRIRSATEAGHWQWTKKPGIKIKLWPPKRGGISKTTLRKIERELRLF